MYSKSVEIDTYSNSTSTTTSKNKTYKQKRFPKKVPHEVFPETNCIAEHSGESPSAYAVNSAAGIHDPTIVHTPPSEFMLHLKERMSVYFK